MKTLTQTLFATLLTAAILGTSAMTTFAGTSEKTEKETSAVTFNRIYVSGNVKLILVQKSKENVSIEEDFNPANTTIRKNGYNLLINSTEAYPVTVTVAVKDLHRIDISGISSVETRGNLELKYLQIFMSYSASASIKAKTGSLYTVITDSAQLKLSGSADEHTFVAKRNAKADMNNFICNKSEKLTTEAIAAISTNRAIVGKFR
ncbi:MAG TPA: DUF2807 domain-containing protein [Pedobacter sp.]|nr:DUF2807 domain-containing protein [Pedobacter sp.]